MDTLRTRTHGRPSARQWGRFVPFLLFMLMPYGKAEAAKLILALGDDSFLTAPALTPIPGTEITNDLGDRDILEFAVIVLSNIPYTILPRAVQERLPEFLDRGGSLLITGGPNAYGSGGYQAIAPLVPFEIRGTTDWIAVPFKAIVLLRPDHPILAGVTFPTVGNFNDLNPRKPGTIEIAQYAGGRTFDQFGQVIGSQFPSPLIAEQRAGRGDVLGIAFDVGRELGSGWADGPRFVQNVLTYLVQRSPLEPRSKAYAIRTFSHWEEACDRQLRRVLAGGVAWKSTAADCRHELAETRFPYMDLVDLWLAERLAIAERVRTGELSEEKGNTEVERLKRRIRSAIEDRANRAERTRGESPSRR